MEYKRNLRVSEGESLVCFGAGEVGERFATLCEKENIKISYFCDNDSKKWGTEFFGVPVISFEEVLQKNETLVFVISNVRYHEEILVQLKENGVKEVYFSFIEEKLREAEDEEIALLDNFLAIKKRNELRQDYPNHLFIESIAEAIITKCTLNCYHCTAMVPYATEYTSVTLEEFKEKVDSYERIFDNILTLILSGGEVMLHPDLYEMIRYASSKPFISRVCVLSNATLLAKEEELSTIDGSKVYFQFTNYGKHSVKLQENIELLKKYQIHSRTLNQEYWLEFPVYMSKQEETEEETLKKYKACIQNYCTSVRNGYLQRCGMSSLAYEHDLAPVEDLDWVDLSLKNNTLPELKEEIKQYLQKEGLSICKYCPGKDITRTQKVPVGVQTREKLVYDPRRDVK